MDMFQQGQLTISWRYAPFVLLNIRMIRTNIEAPLGSFCVWPWRCMWEMRRGMIFCRSTIRQQWRCGSDCLFYQFPFLRLNHGSHLFLLPLWFCSRWLRLCLPGIISWKPFRFFLHFWCWVMEYCILQDLFTISIGCRECIHPRCWLRHRCGFWSGTKLADIGL